jgi:hypothetical protein
MRKLVISSVRRSDSEFVEVTYSLNGEAYTVVMSRANADYSPTAVYNAVRDQLEREHFQANGPDALIRTHPDEDHLFFAGEFVEPESPPQFAETLVQSLAPKRTVQHLLGDLQEVFEKNCNRFGEARARRLYWAQVLRAIGPGIWRRIKRLGLIAFLIDYGRSKLGF